MNCVRAPSASVFSSLRFSSSLITAQGDYREGMQAKIANVVDCLATHPHSKLCCTGFLRVQNATIFPKNVHFFAMLLDGVAKKLNVPLGPYTHFISSGATIEAPRSADAGGI